MMQDDDKISISLAYAVDKHTQLYREVEITQGSTILDALQYVGWLQDFPDLAIWCQNHQQNEPAKKDWFVGVFSQKKALNYVLQPNDRIEIYRSLIIDPMKKRRNRALLQHQQSNKS